MKLVEREVMFNSNSDFSKKTVSIKKSSSKQKTVNPENGGNKSQYVGFVPLRIY